MKRLERAANNDRGKTANVHLPEKSRKKEKKNIDFRALGAAAKRYSGLAAAFVCVIGLAAVLGVMSRSLRMGKSSTAEGIMESASADTAGIQSRGDSVSDNGAPEDKKGAGSSDAQSEEEQETMALDWQEQLLLESSKADELVTWHLSMIYDDGSIGLTSDVVNPSDSSVAAPGKSLHVSGVFEVYLEQGPDEWECIYRTKRTRDNYSAATSWDEWYALDELNMTRAGTYRLVRQVNSYRQVLQLILDER